MRVGAAFLEALGLDSAKSQRTFPLLNDTQVVVYATPTTYYTARYTIDGDTILIDTRHQGTYARADVEVEYYTFEEVVLQDQEALDLKALVCVVLVHPQEVVHHEEVEDQEELARS